jgi:GTPase KRas
VTKEKGEALAAQWGCPFYEASAKTKVNHEECFFQVVREIRKLNAKTANNQGKKSGGIFSRCNLL